MARIMLFFDFVIVERKDVERIDETVGEESAPVENRGTQNDLRSWFWPHRRFSFLAGYFGDPLL
jgi:hypothetical protein